MICPELSIKSLIVWNSWLYGPQSGSAFEVVRFTGWSWHAEHFQSNQLSRGEGWDDTCNSRDTPHPSRHNLQSTVQARNNQDNHNIKTSQPTSGEQSSPDQSPLPRESKDLGAEKELNIELNWHIMWYHGISGDIMPSLGCYVLVFLDMLQSSDWNHSVKPEQIGLDGARGFSPPLHHHHSSS